jgi:hypothetical protein
VVIIYVRRALPESPRWLLTHGRAIEADHTLAGTERQVQRDSSRPLPAVDDSRAIEVRPVRRTSYLTLLRLLFTSYRRRAVLGATLMITQSFLYNAIFFTYTLVLTRFYGVSATLAPVHLIAFAAANLAGPLTIGRLFDTLGRKPMISGTYLGSGALLAITELLLGGPRPAAPGGRRPALVGSSSSAQGRLLADHAAIGDRARVRIRASWD